MLLWTDSTWQKCGVAESDGVLVALSGGADSVALLLELNRLQREGRISRLEAAHLHHGIRGKDADADAAFVCALCDRLCVPLTTDQADAPKLSRENGTSLELAARNARYAFLKRVRAERSLDCIALGHHQDDQAETLLLHLLRGSGTDGLAGYAADVVSEEPIKLRNPLMSAPNCIITSHYAWTPKPMRQKIIDVSAGNLRAYTYGYPVNVVN